MDTDRPGRVVSVIAAASRLGVAGWLGGLVLALAVAAPVLGAGPTLPPVATPTASLPVPTLPPVATPTASLPPLPTLPLPSVPASIPPIPSDPLSNPSPSAPGRGSSGASAEPQPSSSPIASPAAAGPVDQSPSPGGPGPADQPAPQSPFADFALPGLLVGIPALMLISIVALQLAGAVAWFPLIRRWLGRSGAPWASHRRQL